MVVENKLTLFAGLRPLETIVEHVVARLKLLLLRSLRLDEFFGLLELVQLLLGTLEKLIVLRVPMALKLCNLLCRTPNFMLH